VIKRLSYSERGLEMIRKSRESTSLVNACK
jgi:hypothetical protein